MYIFEIEDIVSFVHQLFIKFFKGKNVQNKLKGEASFVSKLSFKAGKGKKLKEYNQRELKAKNEAIIDEIEVCCLATYDAGVDIVFAHTYVAILD